MLGNFPTLLGLGIFDFGFWVGNFWFRVLGWRLMFGVWVHFQEIPETSHFLWNFCVEKWVLFFFKMTFLERVIFQA